VGYLIITLLQMFHKVCTRNDFGQYWSIFGEDNGHKMHQALLKAKYSPWVAAVSRTQKNTKKPMRRASTDDLEIQ